MSLGVFLSEVPIFDPITIGKIDTSSPIAMLNEEDAAVQLADNDDLFYHLADKLIKDVIFDRINIETIINATMKNLKAS